MMDVKKILIEICCGSADDAFEAAAGGADRVELTSAPFLGGLTPSIGGLKTARKAGLEIMAMLRPRQGGFCYTDLEFETMLADAYALLESGADGLVFGILHEDGTIDEERCTKLLETAGGKQCVFHRAIDVTPDWRDALEKICALGFSRVLTSGCAPSVQYGAAVVREMAELAKGRVEILPGGGVTLANAREILDITGCSQIHASMSVKRRDSSSMANPAIHFCGAVYPPDDVYTASDGAVIRKLVKELGKTL
jgi:copper homeostasis protein